MHFFNSSLRSDAAQLLKFYSADCEQATLMPSALLLHRNEYMKIEKIISAACFVLK